MCNCLNQDKSPNSSRPGFRAVVNCPRITVSVEQFLLFKMGMCWRDRTLVMAYCCWLHPQKRTTSLAS